MSAILVLLVALLACGPAADPDAGRLGNPLPDAEVAQLYGDLESRDPVRIEAALARITAAPDRRFVSVLIEGLRVAHLDEGESQAYNARVVALERLSGESLGGDWFRWAEWYETARLEPPPGFLDYKGRLLSRVHPGFAAFLDSSHPSRLEPEQIRWGGVAPGGIPALTRPARVSAEEASWLADDEAVFGLVHAGEARAYPVRILDWHELVNDRFGSGNDGEFVTLSYCTLCNSGLAYRAGARSFETSGLLYRSNKLMFDHETRTLWSQLEGRPVLGPLAASDIRLEVLPMVVTTWGAWREQHPDTSVLSIETGHEREYAIGMPYGGYFASHKLMFPSGARDDRLAAKALVYGVTLGGAAAAWPVETLVAERVVNGAVGETEVVLVAPRGAVELEGEAPRTGLVRYVAGAEVRVYRSAGTSFAIGDSPGTLTDEKGRRWRVTEAALVGPDGASAPRVPGGIVYWFAWRSFHPDTEVHLP